MDLEHRHLQDALEEEISYGADMLQNRTVTMFAKEDKGAKTSAV